MTLCPLPCDKLAGGSKGRDSGFILGTRDPLLLLVAKTKCSVRLIQGTSALEKGCRSLADGDVGLRFGSDKELSAFRISASLGTQKKERRGRRKRPLLKGYLISRRGTGVPRAFGEYQFGGRDLSRQPVENKCGAPCNFLNSDSNAKSCVEESKRKAGDTYELCPKRRDRYISETRLLFAISRSLLVFLLSSKKRRDHPGSVSRLATQR